MAFDFDLLVIGSGPAGQRAAIQAAKLGRRVAVVERRLDRRGLHEHRDDPLEDAACRGARPDARQQDRFGDTYRVKSDITVEDLFWRTRRVIDRETAVIRDQLPRNHVEVISGPARSSNSHTVGIAAPRAHG